MKIDLRKNLFKLLFENKKIVSNKSVSDEISMKNEPIQFEEKSFRKSFNYRRHENVKIDSNFKYYHFDLTGDVSKDFRYLYGKNDNHNSKAVLEHSLIDNILRIKRSHDIILHKKDDVYTIYNGRHRLVYLSHYFQKISPANGFEAPALVTNEFEDERVNEILEALINDLGASVYKYNYYDDEAAFCIILNKNVYIVNNSLELEEFYNGIDNCEEKYHYSKLNEVVKTDFNKLFEEITKIVGNKLFEMNFLDLLNFIRDNDILIDNTRVAIENMDIVRFYHYYFNISHNVQYCKIHNHEIPEGLDVLNAIYLPINRCGHMIMEFLYENVEYKNLTWNELFEIIHVFPEFEEYDSELLLESAKRFGYVEGTEKKVQKKKRIAFH